MTKLKTLHARWMMTPAYRKAYAESTDEPATTAPGSSLDDFLRREGIHEAAESQAVEEVQRLLQAQSQTKTTRG